MTTILTLTAEHCHRLDMTPAKAIIEPWLTADTPIDSGQDLQFHIDYPQDPEAPVEFPEIPEVRLWFMRLDSLYPWLPWCLDWQIELVRYAAMLVPHDFSTQEGIQFNPQALDLFVMQKVFVIDQWLQNQNIEGASKLQQMAEVFGYELDQSLFQLLRQ